MATVVLHTNMGQIKLELDEESTPKTTANFLQYAEEGFYSNTLFHRVIDGFMIQGGGLNPDMSSKETRDPIENEAQTGRKNAVGTIAMARTSDPHSATSQFFINVADNNFLNFKAETEEAWGYCAFGKVVEGMDIVQNISHVNTINRSGHQDVPERDVVLERVDLVTETTPVE